MLVFFVEIRCRFATVNDIPTDVKRFRNPSMHQNYCFQPRTCWQTYSSSNSIIGLGEYLLLIPTHPSASSTTCFTGQHWGTEARTSPVFVTQRHAVKWNMRPLISDPWRLKNYTVSWLFYYSNGGFIKQKTRQIRRRRVDLTIVNATETYRVVAKLKPGYHFLWTTL